MAGESRMNQAVPAAKATDLWLAPEEVTDNARFREMLAREFPDDAETWSDPVTRRQFITLMSASVALAGMAGCSPRPASPKTIVPYTTIPNGMTPGNPMYFATAVTLSGIAAGVIVRSNEGRPTKIEGNPFHPGSLGGTDVFTQAELLNLYDPDRAQTLSYQGASRTWEETVSSLRGVLAADSKKSKQIRILTETITSPTLAKEIERFGKKHKNVQWVQYEPATRDNSREGSKRAFGAYVNTVYDFTKAKVVLALDADFLTSGPGNVRYARDFMSRRRVRKGVDEHGKADGVKPDEMNRLYAVEPMLTCTGAVADHRLPLKGAEVEAFVIALADELKVPGAPKAGTIPESAKAWVKPLAEDLRKHEGASVVVVGDCQPAAVHSLAHAINAHLKNDGKTVLHFKPCEAKPENQAVAFRKLVEEMTADKVDVLFILGGNPVFSAPVDLKFKEALAKVGLRIHLSDSNDETAAQCQWIINSAHCLETWGDALAYDGTASIQQPLIKPLYDGHSALELIGALATEPENPISSALELVQAHWKTWFEEHKGKSESDFDQFWHESLRKGVVAGTGREALDSAPSIKEGWAVDQKSAAPGGNYEINFRIDPTIYDGRFANNGWLQELPKPITKLCWDNAAIVSPKTGAKLGLTVTPRWTAGERGRMETEYVELTLGGQKLKVAAWIQPGHVDDSVTLYLGAGRERAGRVGDGVGFNTYKLRTSAQPWTTGGLEVQKLEDTMFLACTQAHFKMEGRKPVRHMKRSQYLNEQERSDAMAPAVAAAEKALIDANVPHVKEEHAHDHEHDKEHGHKHDERLKPLTLYPDMHKDAGHRWAMAIDLTSCMGCNACMIACQAENNIPVVGKTEVTRAREMHWIRVDRYFTGEPDDAEGLKTYFQPVPCQQCEKAPCELVCPVGATTHSTDGLNDMAYNRCVGTRYCSNNCPYKVRRFNFFTYADYVTESLKLGRNPEVTVRSRGVMEKCTYCVQRIRAAEIEAEREFATRDKLPPPSSRPKIKDGEIKTACEMVCPAGAIVFGDLADPKSVVGRWKMEPTNYGLLEELNTMPRTTYLAALRNPNRAMPGEEQEMKGA